MSEDKAKNYFQITTDRMCTALEAFYIWKKLNEVMNVNEVGVGEAERNVEILNKHWGFFHVTLASLYKSFIIDLSIFFDTDKYEDTFSLKKLLDEIKLKTTGEEYNKLQETISQIKKKHGVKINLLLELRNSEVGHQEIERKRRLIIYKEIEELFVGVQEILNTVQKYYDGAYTVWDHIGREASAGALWLIESLKIADKLRLEEISKKYPISL